MNNISKLLLAGVCVLGMTGCSESFLDTKNLTGKDNTNFPSTQAEIDQALVACYQTMMGDPNNEFANTDFLATLMSDDCFPGGGTDDRKFMAVGAMKQLDGDQYKPYWENRYKGIYRCNYLIEVAQNMDMDEATLNQMLGEVYFLRGLYYFELGRVFENVPVLLSSQPSNVPQATPEELYAVVAHDLKKAVELLPAVPYNTAWGTAHYGSTSKWAAEGILARAFLFYTGFYNKETMPVASEDSGAEPGVVKIGGELTKSEVISYVDDCIANSGHSLISDFRNLWGYSYCPDYKYNMENGLSWAMDDGTNPEVLFAARHGYIHPSGDNWTNNGRNWTIVCYGLRYQDEGAGYNTDGVYPFGAGWGAGTVTKSLYNSFASNDPRRQGSIINVDDPSEGLTYTDNCSNQWYDTHLFIKKYTPINVHSDDPTINGGVGYAPMACLIYPGYTQNDMQVVNLVSFIYLRFADVLLMGAELGGPNAQSYLDRVRARVGLESVPATLANIKNERRWELAFEAVRYYDLLRWHDEDVLSANRSNVELMMAGEKQVISLPFRKETRGFLPIPRSEIEKSEGMLKQNAGWTGPEANL